MSLTLSHYGFTLRAEQEMRLPEYLGSTLRGGFGHTLVPIPHSAIPGPPLPPGSLLCFGLTLIGQARDSFPYFVEMKMGLNNLRSSCMIILEGGAYEYS